MLYCGVRAVAEFGHSDFLVRNLFGDLTGPRNRGVVTLGFDACSRGGSQSGAEQKLMKSEMVAAYPIREGRPRHVVAEIIIS